MEGASGGELTLVARKPGFGLPTACPSCLPVYIYLRFAQIPFQLNFNNTYPDSAQIPYVESGVYVAYNNEKGGVIESLKEDKIADLDTDLHSVPEWLSTNVMISSWLAEALLYELWVESDRDVTYKVYYSDLPWPIGKLLYLKEVRAVRQLLGLTKDNAELRESEIYRRAKLAYEALSSRLWENKFFFEDRPSSVDAIFLGHALFTLQALPETSVLRTELLKHSNLVRYAENLKMELLEAGSSASSVPPVGSAPSSSTPRRGSSKWSSKPKNKPKREKTEEEKTFKKRAKYFVVAQLVAVLVFLSILGGSGDDDLEFDDEDEGF